MNSTLTTVVILLCVQLAAGVPLFAKYVTRTTKHWEREPREKTTKHIEIEPRGTTITHWEVPEILPRKQNQGSLKNSEILLTEEPFEGGDGTVPPGALNDGRDKAIIMVPFGLIVGSGTIPPVDLNEGGDKEINMVPSGLVVGSGNLPPGALNDGGDDEINMVPSGLVVGSGTIPPGALDDGGDKDISMVPYVISKAPFDNTPVPEGPWNGSQGTPPPGAQNDWSSSSFMRGARFLLRAFGF